MNKILNHEKLIIAVILLITVFFVFQIPKININNDIKVFLPDNNPVKVMNNKIEDIFGGNERIIVALKARSGDLFTLKSISLIDKLTNQFGDIAGVDEVTSLSNADYIEGTAEGMVVEELLEDLPGDEEGIAELKKKLLSWDFYRNNLYSKDFKSTQILISLKDNLTTEETDKIYFNVKNITNKYVIDADEMEVHIAGVSAVNVLMGDSMLQDIKRLVPFVIIILILFLFIFFKRIYPVVLTLVTVLISTIWAVGLMALLGVNMTIVTTIIPVLLIAVGSAYGIHILSHYYDDLIGEREKIGPEKHREIVLKTVNRMGKPVFLAGLTTLVGFGSLATSKIVPIQDFGIFAAVGIGSAFLIAIFLIPALLLISFNRITGLSGSKNRVDKFFESMLTWFHEFYAGKKVGILIVSSLVIIVSVVGMSKIIIDTPLIEMFKESTSVRKADEFINKNFAGTSIMNVMVEGQGKGSLTDPEILKEMDNLKYYLMNNTEAVGKVISITDFIKRMNRVMHYNEPIDNYASRSTVNTDQENSSDSYTTASNDSKETTSSFYSQSSANKDSEETTSDFYSQSGKDDDSEETTSSFYSDSTGNSVEQETALSFYNESGDDTDSPIQDNKSNYVTGDTDKSVSSVDGIAEYEFARVLNNALSRADRLGLSGEELIRLINKELNYHGAAYDEIPYNPAKYPASNRQGLKNLISQYLLLYSGNLDDLINDQLEPDKAQMVIQLKDPSNLTAAQIEKKIKNYTEEHFPEGYTVKVSGFSAMGMAANNLIVHSQTMSIFISFIIVFIIVAVSYRSYIAGIFGIIPLAFSLLINFGLMGFSGIKLDIGTAMVASIAIGIGVDYTIHFLAGYHAERLKSDDLFLVTGNTLRSTGKAIVFNALSVAAGFMVLTFSNFYPLIYLGLLITLTMLTSSLAALTILPVLLNIFKPAFISKK